jgi:hypothetical protein
MHHADDYIEGKNYTLDYIDVQRQPQRCGEGMREIVQRKPDIIVAFGPKLRYVRP